ncbi:MAG: type II toxin-antitoxin system Phd/YefM family antitoxin [Firmicutes bacterium]|nr:type II toxin-antitoxin system Phd/YefM family antitoxin [Bacillota bacterium]
MNIRPSSDLRNHYAELSQLCKESGNPVFLTVNGRGDTVLLSLREYERQQALLAINDAIAEGEADIKEGRVFTVKQASKAMKDVIDSYR